MAQMILSSVGQAVGGPIGAVIGSTLGRAIDQRLMSSLEPSRQKGPRLETLKVQGTAEGAPMAGVSEVAYAMTGAHDRPWSPAHVRAEARPDGGFNLGWVARSRIDGDRWDGEPAEAELMRFRVRILVGTTALRMFEVEARTALYQAADAAADFPGGPGPDAAVAVAQWGEGYGWGPEATATLG